MFNLISHSLNPKDEPTLQQLEIYLQQLSQDKKAAIAMTAIYEATKPDAVDFDHICDRCPKFNKAIALLQDLSHLGLLAVVRAITEELAMRFIPQMRCARWLSSRHNYRARDISR